MLGKLLCLGLVPLALAATAVAGGTGPPRIRAENFVAGVDNPWFPLKPGTTYVYRGVKDGKTARDVFTVTHATKLIQGVRCTVVDDRLYLRGRLAERTTDWYAQPYTSSKRALLTREWTPLEPGVVDHKLYVRGIGMVKEETVKGGDERFVLVSLQRD